MKYEDVRVEKEEWAKLKPNTPTGMLPLLEVDGKQIPGSGPIVRFLAKRFDLAGKDDIETAELDGMSDVVTDFMSSFAKLFGIKDEDEAKKAEVMKQLQENDIPKYWGVIEKNLESSKTDFYKDRVTYFDIGVYTVLEFILPVFPNFLDKFPNVAKLQEKVGALPKIAEWVKNRPKSDY